VIRVRLEGQHSGRAHELSTVSAGSARPAMRRANGCADGAGAWPASSGGAHREAIWLALVDGEPREAATILHRAGVSAGSHDVRVTLVSGRQYDELACPSRVDGRHPLHPQAARSAAAPGRRCGIVLVVSDRRLLSARVDALACGDKGIAAEFMRILLDSNRTMLTAIETAADRAAWSELGDAMHRLNGSLGLFNCGDVVELAARIERAVRRRDAQSVRAVLPIFSSVVRSLNAVLTRALECETAADARL
jgi:HPt (histidine-containing phosphotransfer) domain-containing protein